MSGGVREIRVRRTDYVLTNDQPVLARREITALSENRRCRIDQEIRGCSVHAGLSAGPPSSTDEPASSYRPLGTDHHACDVKQPAGRHADLDAGRLAAGARADVLRRAFIGRARKERRQQSLPVFFGFRRRVGLDERVVAAFRHDDGGRRRRGKPHRRRTRQRVVGLRSLARALTASTPRRIEERIDLRPGQRITVLVGLMPCR